MQEEVYGSPRFGLKEVIERLILTGLVAGFASSFLVVTAGVTIETDTVRYLFYIMSLLLLLDLRFVSFPYAAGLLSAASFIFSTLKVNVPSLLCLAAMLQMLEGLLVFLSRKDGYIPVYMRHQGEITGAFLIRRFWMIPVVFMTYLVQPETMTPMQPGSMMPMRLETILPDLRQVCPCRSARKSWPGPLARWGLTA